VSDTIDFAAEGLLDGLEGESRDERERLLRSLHEEGVSVDQLRRATASGALLFMGADRLVGGGSEYTLEEIAEQSGLDLDFIMASMRASGLAVPALDERTLGESDLELACVARRFRELGFPDEDMLEVTRVLAHGLSQGGEAIRRITLKRVLSPGADEAEIATGFAKVAAAGMPLVDDLLAQMMRVQLRNVVRTEATNAAERAAGSLPGAREIAICFADLVGFTRVGEEVPPDELGRIATRLEGLTTQTLSRPVRLVKSIGDAVMLVSPETPPLLDCALALIAAADEQESDLPQLRAGVATGPAMSRAGDWYGRPVNLASRITGIARPGSMLAAREVRDQLADADRYRWSFAGARRLKGIREPVPLYRVRRAET
jgi:adenylate cyclase